MSSADDGGIKVANLLVVADGRQRTAVRRPDRDQGRLLVKVSPYRAQAQRLGRWRPDLHRRPRGQRLAGGAELQRRAVHTNAATLVPGLTARLSLTYASGAQTTLVVPVVSSSNPIYTAGLGRDPVAHAERPGGGDHPGASTTP